jgi:hypothetical protein
MSKIKLFAAIQNQLSWESKFWSSENRREFAIYIQDPKN